MKKYNLILCDNDTVFMSSFQRYITKQEDASDFKVRCFSSLEYLKKYSPIKEDVLLITSELFFEDLHKYGFNNIVTLISNEENLDKKLNFPNQVRKYQPPSSLLEQVKAYINKEMKRSTFGLSSNSKLITFYSPVGGIGNTTLSLLTCYILSKKNSKVLYINLEDIQSTKSFLPCNNKEKNLSHLSCYTNENLGKFTKGMNDIVCTEENLHFDYFQPFDSILDIQEFNRDAQELIEKILKTGIYSYVVADIGNGMAITNKKMLKNSYKVVMATNTDKISITKVSSILEQFYDFNNIRIVLNKFSEKKESLIQSVIKKYPVPVIGKINKNNDIEGTYDISLLAKNEDFIFDVTKVVENIFDLKG